MTRLIRLSLLVDPVSFTVYYTSSSYTSIGDTEHNGQRVGVQSSSILTGCAQEIEEMGAESDSRISYQQLEV